MGKLKLGILGNSYLADITVETGLKGMLDEYESVEVLDRTREKVELLTKKGGCQACGTIDELLALPLDHVAEAASIQSVKGYGVKILEPGTGMIMLSIRVFVNHEFLGQIKIAAAGHKARMYIMSGTAGGFDVLWTISLAGQAETGTRTGKGLASLKGTPLSVKRPMEDGTESYVSHGSAKEVISFLPTKVNVIVASSLATAGPEGTRADIYSVLGMVGDDHKITSEIEGVKAVVDIYSSTSAIAGWNVVAVLRNIVSPIVSQEETDMFKKLVAIESVSLILSAEEELHRYAGETTLHEDMPSGDGEIIRYIGDADAVLVNYTSRISRHVIGSCPSVRYIGTCCSPYSEESANVDTACTRERGIIVSGIRDYGDRGAMEYILSELVCFPYSPDCPMFCDTPIEITGLKVDIIGMGVSGGMITDALRFMGTDVSCYSRSREQGREDRGMIYRPLKELPDRSEVVSACLSKGMILLHEKEFRQLGQGRLLFNTSIEPAFDLSALKTWSGQGSNYFICDTEGVLGDSTGELLDHPGVFCARISAGRTKQAFDLLNKEVLDNIRAHLKQ